MKTFKQHVKEGMSPLGVGVSTSNAVEDSALGAHNIDNPDVLKRVNALLVQFLKENLLNHNTQLTN